MPIGFRSPKHQGWFNRKHYPNKDLNPYPLGSEARNQYISGENCAHKGEHWEAEKVKRKYKRQFGHANA